MAGKVAPGSYTQEAFEAAKAALIVAEVDEQADEPTEEQQ